MADHPDSIKIIDSRIEQLEKIVYDTETASKNPPQSIISVLNNANQSMSTALKNRDPINALFQQLPKLNEYLDPNLSTTDELDVEAKEAYILAMSDTIHHNFEQLSKIESLKSALDASATENITALTPQLSGLNGDYLQMKGENYEFVDGAENLLAKCDEIMRVVNEQLTRISCRINLLEQKPAK